MPCRLAQHHNGPRQLPLSGRGCLGQTEPSMPPPADIAMPGALFRGLLCFSHLLHQSFLSGHVKQTCRIGPHPLQCQGILLR